MIAKQQHDTVCPPLDPPDHRQERPQERCQERRSLRQRITAGGWLVFLLPAAAELIAGGYQLSRPSLWRDEAYTLESAQRSVPQIVALMDRLDAVHAPYYLLMHFVIGAAGDSAVALRLPSLICTAVAAGMIAVLGRRLAAASGLSAPATVGVVAGLFFVAVPQTTFYAQDARPYGLTTMFAVLASYFLVRAIAVPRWRWWACYAVALVATGVFSLFALLLVPAHLLTLLVTMAVRTRAGRTEAGRTEAGRTEAGRTEPGCAEAGRTGAVRIRAWRTGVIRWLTAVVLAGVALSPLVVLGYQQDRTLAWVTRPGTLAFIHLLTDFAGTRRLIPLVALIALAGLIGGRSARSAAPSPALSWLALPWLVLPPLMLLAVSQVRPVYVERYVNFCLPALALLVAAALAWITHQAQRVIRTPGWSARALGVVPAVILAAAMLVLVARPQHAIRQPGAHYDNLRKVSAIVATREQPGDAVFYLPSETRVVGFAYPAPFLRLRDVALAGPVAASGTPSGVQVSPATLAQRFAGVTRVWVLTWTIYRHDPPTAATGKQEAALISGWHLAGTWTVRTVVLSLYERPS